uniref:Uncharacterized protein n=1 Tax=Arundo donax TaxID=35708 RepID=A0A0A9CBU3_ARUDO
MEGVRPWMLSSPGAPRARCSAATAQLVQVEVQMRMAKLH